MPSRRRSNTMCTMVKRTFVLRLSHSNIFHRSISVFTNNLKSTRWLKSLAWYNHVCSEAAFGCLMSKQMRTENSMMEKCAREICTRFAYAKQFKRTHSMHVERELRITTFRPTKLKRISCMPIVASAYSWRKCAATTFFFLYIHCSVSTFLRTFFQHRKKEMILFVLF